MGDCEELADKNIIWNNMSNDSITMQMFLVML